jgi:hypothetical protein
MKNGKWQNGKILCQRRKKFHKIGYYSILFCRKFTTGSNCIGSLPGLPSGWNTLMVNSRRHRFRSALFKSSGKIMMTSQKLNFKLIKKQQREYLKKRTVRGHSNKT